VVFKEERVVRDKKAIPDHLAQWASKENGDLKVTQERLEPLVNLDHRVMMVHLVSLALMDMQALLDLSVLGEGKDELDLMDSPVKMAEGDHPDPQDLVENLELKHHVWFSFHEGILTKDQDQWQEEELVVTEEQLVVVEMAASVEEEELAVAAEESVVEEDQRSAVAAAQLEAAVLEEEEYLVEEEDLALLVEEYLVVVV